MRKGLVMRTATATLTGALIASLLVGPSAAVLGQSEATASSTHVTGTVIEQTRYESDDVSASQAGDVMREEGHIYKQRVDWSDPRLPAEHWVRMDLAIHDEGSEDGVMTVQTSHLLTDSDGAWRGTGRALETETDRYSYYELIGEGAYEGLHALLRGTPGKDAHGPWDLEYDGWIFEGPLMGFPEPAEPASGEGVTMRTAPDPEAATGSSAPSDPMAPAAFRYTLETQGEPNWGVRQESADGTMLERRGFEQVERLEATDPRASGLMTTSENWTQVEAGGTRVDTTSVMVRLTNDAGSWSGPGERIGAVSDQVMEMAGITTLTGEGDYEGLTLYLGQSGDYLSQTSWGTIVPSELVAPMPEPVEPDEE